MKHTGIWLDKKKAIIVTLQNDKEEIHTIQSDINDFHVTANRFIGGALEEVQDSKYLNREKQQFKTYFKDITEEIEDTDALVIFGPAETYREFANELSKSYKKLSNKVKGVKNADSMTENQVKAWVKDFFKVR